MIDIVKECSTTARYKKYFVEYPAGGSKNFTIQRQSLYEDCKTSTGPSLMKLNNFNK